MNQSETFPGIFQARRTMSFSSLVISGKAQSWELLMIISPDSWRTKVDKWSQQCRETLRWDIKRVIREDALALVSIISKANSTFVLPKLGVSEPIKSCFLLESVCFCFYLWKQKNPKNIILVQLYLIEIIWIDKNCWWQLILVNDTLFLYALYFNFFKSIIYYFCNKTHLGKREHKIV